LALFVDQAKIEVKAGDGGDGKVSFHREKYVAAGGPDGGDGGRGGSIVFVADPGMHTLLDFQYRRKFLAEDGQPGGPNRMGGKAGQDLTIKVPPGTLVKDGETGLVLADLTEDGLPQVLFRGGRGGWGNSHFANPVRQAPRFANPGQKGKRARLVLELRSIADVGLVGFPNVGKSTMLAGLTAAKPKIANYHFTTLTPNLGVVRAYGDGFVLADIPGLIEGASEGAGLGHTFLRHIERTRLLVHVVDVSGSEGRDPVEDVHAINRELSRYGELRSRPQLLCANKTDLPGADENLARLKAAFPGLEIFPACAPISEGLEPLVARCAELLKTLPPIESFIDDLPEEIPADLSEFRVFRENDWYVVEGPLVQGLLRRVDLDDDESLAYFEGVLRRSGIIDALRQRGAKDGDSVRLGEIEFDFVD
jgi:GTP-binding protein